jgi:hypothetical protein
MEVFVESIKFETEDMEKIKKMQNDYFAFSVEYGQLGVEKKISEERLKNVEQLMTDAWDKYLKLRDDEQAMIDEFNKKYGDGVLDLENGTFQPRAETDQQN